MALVLIDGFDYLSDAVYTNDDLAGRWSTHGTALTSYFKRAGGRGGSGYSLYIYSDNNYAEATFDQSDNHMFFGFGFYPNDDQGYTGSRLFRLLNQAGTSLCALQYQLDGSLAFMANTSTALEISIKQLAIGQWYWIEGHVLLDGAGAGSYEVKVNGEVWLSGTAVATCTSTDNAPRSIRLGGGQNATSLYDDLYLCNSLGSTNNGNLGEVKVELLTPTGAGSDSDWTPSAGANWECVDENPADGSTYVETGGSNQKDRYAISDLSSDTVEVLGLQVEARAKLTTAGDMPLKLVAYDGTTEAISERVFPTFAQYNTLAVLLETKPSGGAWTPATVNAAEIGVVTNG